MKLSYSLLLLSSFLLLDQSIPALADWRSGILGQDSIANSAQKKAEELHKGYYNWDLGRLQNWIEEHGISPAEEKDSWKNWDLSTTRNYVQDKFDKVYDEWSDSQISSWISAHPLVPTATKSTPENLKDTIRRYYEDDFSSWNEVDLVGWLEDHNIPVPDGYSKSKKTLLTKVKDAWNEQRKAYSAPSSIINLEFLANNDDQTVSEKISEAVDKSGESLKNQGQQIFKQAQKGRQQISESIFDTLTESQIHKFLVDYGKVAEKTISNTSKDDLVKLAKSKYKDLQNSKGAVAAADTLNKANKYIYSVLDSANNVAENAAASVSSAASQAGDNVANAASAATSHASNIGNTLKSSLSDILDAPRLAYDFLAENYDITKDYIYSTWSNTDLASYIEKHTNIKVKDINNRDDLLKQVKQAYDDSAENVYDSWSDSTARKWLIKHGLIRPNNLSTGEELRELLARNYYSAFDTTFTSWSPKQLHSWAVKKGLIPKDQEFSLGKNIAEQRDNLVNLVSDKYYEARDKVYDNWDDSEIKSWLVNRNVITSDSDISHEELLKLIKNTFYTANDKVWDSWSDAKIRSYLIKNQVLDKAEAAKLKRDELVEYLDESYINIQQTVEDKKEWLIGSGKIHKTAELTEEEILQKYDYFYGKTMSLASEYLTWGDNRLRGWLRENNIDFDEANAKREDLLKIVKENYMSIQNSFPTFFKNVNSKIHQAVTLTNEEAFNLIQTFKNWIFGVKEEAITDYLFNEKEILKGKASNVASSLESAAGKASQSASKFTNEL